MGDNVPGEKQEHQSEDADRKKLKGLALLIYDLKQPKLIPIKLLSLIVFSGYGVLLPYTAIHMKSLGITVEETGAIYGVSSIVGALTPFGIGMIADKLGNFKMLLSAMPGFASLCALLFLLVPGGRSSVDYPANLTLAVGCHNDSANGSDAAVQLTVLHTNSCDFKLTDPSARDDAANVTVMVDECGTLCSDNIWPLHSNYNSERVSYITNVNFLDVASQRPLKFRDTLFFPNDSSLRMSCSPTFEGKMDWHVCIYGPQSGTEAFHVIVGLVSSFNSTNRGVFSVKLLVAEDEADIGRMSSNFHCGKKPNSTEMKELQVFDLRSESAFHNSTSFSEKWKQEDNDNSPPYLPFCRPQCLVQIQRSQLCSNMVEVKDINPQLTFWLYMLLRLIFEILLGGSAALFDGASLALVNEVRGDFGFQKMFGFIGIAIFSPISGALIDHYSTDESTQDFRPAYYLFAGLFGTAAIGMLTINLEFKPPANELFKDVKSLFRNIELDVLLVISLIAGILLGCTGNFLFLFIEEIGGTKSLIGLSITVSCLSAVPLLLFSDVIFRKVGLANVLVVCFATYVIRLIGYSYIYEPRLCLLFESIEAVTGTLMMTSLITYSAQLGKTSTLASIQGLLSGIYFGLGGGAGSSVGSFLIGAYGQRVTFRILGVIALITGLTYMLFNIFYLHRKNIAEMQEGQVNCHKEC